MRSDFVVWATVMQREPVLESYDNEGQFHVDHYVWEEDYLHPVINGRFKMFKCKDQGFAHSLIWTSNKIALGDRPHIDYPYPIEGYKPQIDGDEADLIELIHPDEMLITYFEFSGEKLKGFEDIGIGDNNYDGSTDPDKFAKMTEFIKAANRKRAKTWVSPNIILPPNEMPVIIATASGEVKEGYCFKPDDKRTKARWYSHNGLETVKQWMLFPEHPENN